MNRFATVLMFAFILGSAPALAGEQMSAAQAKKEFARATALYKKNRFDEALPKFEKLVAATDSPNARLYVARCLRELGKLPAAYEAMTQTMRFADAKARTDSYYADTRSAAAAERAALESKIVRVVVALADPPKDLEIELNGNALPRDRLGDTIAIEPGRLVVRASAPGFSTFETQDGPETGSKRDRRGSVAGEGRQRRRHATRGRAKAHGGVEARAGHEAGNNERRIGSSDHRIRFPRSRSGGHGNVRRCGSQRELPVQVIEGRVQRALPRIQEERR